MRLRAGDLVEVRNKDDILRTLDKEGCLDGLPFMPQMFQYCGQRFRIYKRAHKTCDTISKTGGRRLANTVHLDLRCDGTAYGGCQAGCLLFWNEAWLAPCRSEGASSAGDTRLTASNPAAEECSEDDVWNATRMKDRGDGETCYSCQATKLLSYTAPLTWWHFGQYIEDYTSGNTTIGRFLRALLYVSLLPVNSRFPVLRGLHDRLMASFGGVPFPRRVGTIPDGELTPTGTLDLRPGELVRVKPYSEILATLDRSNKNRGLYFDAELVPYCGGIYRVKTKIDPFIDEDSGKLRKT